MTELVPGKNIFRSVFYACSGTSLFYSMYRLVVLFILISFYRKVFICNSHKESLINTVIHCLGTYRLLIFSHLPCAYHHINSYFWTISLIDNLFLYCFSKLLIFKYFRYRSSCSNIVISLILCDLG